MTTPLYTLADLGSGHQITRLRAGGRDWRFSEAPLWTLTPITVSTQALATAWTPSDFNAPTVVDDGSTFTATWLNSEGSEVEVTGALNAAGYLRMTFEATLAGADATTYVINRYSHRFRLNPYDAGDLSDWRLYFPHLGGVCKQSVASDGASVIMDVPFSEAPYPDTSKAATYFGASQFVYPYQPGSRAGLIIRTTDTTGLFKRFSVTGDGSTSTVEVTHFPPGNADDTTAHTLSYAVELRPVTGDSYFDGVTAMRDIIVSEAQPQLARGKLAAEVGTYEQKKVSEGIEDMDIVVATGLSFGTETEDATNIALEADRFNSWLDSGTKVLHWLGGGWHANQFGQGWPDFLPVQTGAVGLLAITKALGWFNTIYTFMGPVEASGDWYTADFDPAYGDPATLVALNRDQSVQSISLSQGPTAFLNLAQANARNHMRTWWRQAATDLGNVDGFYVDALTRAFVQDYRSTLTAAEKGIGSATLPAGVRSLIEELKDDYRRTLDADFAFMSEQFTEDLLGIYDALTLFGYVLTVDETTSQDNRKVGGTIAQYGEWHNLISYFGPGPLDSAWQAGDPSAQAFLAEPQAHSVAHDFAIGMPPCVAITADPQYQLIASDSPPEPWFSGVWEAQQKYLAVVKTCANLRRVFGKYHKRGRRLRPLPGSREREIEATGLALSTTAASNPIGFEFDMDSDTPFGVVCQTMEEAGDPVGVTLINYRGEAQDFTVTMTRTDYPALAGRGKLYTADLATAARTYIKDFVGYLEHTVSVPARGAVVLEILPSDNPQLLLREDGTAFLRETGSGLGNYIRRE